MGKQWNLDDIRAKTRAICQRAGSDEAYRQRVQDDPVAIFTEAGIPAEVFPDLLRETTDAPDVQGFMKCAATQDDGCHDFTCWTSGCPGSCYATL